MINKTHTSPQKPRRRQLNAKVCYILLHFNVFLFSCKYQCVLCTTYSQVTAGIGVPTFFKGSGVAVIENTVKSVNWS